jgi:hypothetical protein
MAQQTSGVQLRPDLQELALDFDAVNARRGFVGTNIMPIVSVGAQSGPFPKLSAKELMRTGKTERAPRAGYGRGFSEFGSDEYTTKEHGWEEVVDDTFARIYSDYINAEMVATDICNGVLAQSQEVRIRDLVYAESANNVGTAWSDPSSTPQQDTRDAMRSVELAIGMKPNLLTLTEKKMQDVLKTAEYLDNAKSVVNVSAMNLSEQVQAVRAFLDVPQLQIASGIYDANGEGEAMAGAYIWDDDKAFLSVAGNSIAGGPKFGLTLEWSEDSLSGTESYYEDATRGTVIRVRHHRGEKKMLSEAGWLLGNL